MTQHTFTPPRGVWTEHLAAAHPLDAVAWAKAQRACLGERGRRNDMMDGGWSAGEADLCARGVAEADRVELAALRALLKAAAAKMDAGAAVWTEPWGWCPEFQALRIA